MKVIVVCLCTIFVGTLFAQVSRECGATEAAPSKVTLILNSLTSERDERGYLRFRATFTLRNASDQPISVVVDKPTDTPTYIALTRCFWDRNEVRYGWGHDVPSGVPHSILPQRELVFTRSFESPSVYHLPQHPPLMGDILVFVYYRSHNSKTNSFPDMSDPAQGVAIARFPVIWPKEVTCLDGYWPKASTEPCPQAKK